MGDASDEESCIDDAENYLKSTTASAASETECPGLRRSTRHRRPSMILGYAGHFVQVTGKCSPTILPASGLEVWSHRRRPLPGPARMAPRSVALSLKEHCFNFTVPDGTASVDEVIDGLEDVMGS
ncbi:hypothetical protein MTO96_017121 [Rhipicephalus appendiculatus]